MADRPPHTTATGSPRRRGSGLLVIALTGLGFLILGTSALLLSYNGIHQVAELGAQDRDLAGLPLTHLYPAMYTVLLLLAFAGSYVLRGARWPRRLFTDALILLLIVLGAVASVLYSLDLRLDGPSTTAVLAAMPLPVAAIGFYLWRAISAHLRDRPPAGDGEATRPARAAEDPELVTVPFSELTGSAAEARPEEPVPAAETMRVRRAVRPDPAPASVRAPERTPAAGPEPEPAAAAAAEPAAEPTKPVEPAEPADEAASATAPDAAKRAADTEEADTTPTQPLASVSDTPRPDSATTQAAAAGTDTDTSTATDTDTAASAASAPVAATQPAKPATPPAEDPEPETPAPEVTAADPVEAARATADAVDTTDTTDKDTADTTTDTTTEAAAAPTTPASDRAATDPTTDTDEPGASPEPAERAEGAQGAETPADSEPVGGDTLPKRTPRSSDIARKARSLTEQPATTSNVADGTAADQPMDPETDAGTVWIDDAFVPDAPADDPTSDEALPAIGPGGETGGEFGEPGETTVPASFADVAELRSRPMVRRPRRGSAADVPTDPPSGRVRSEPVPPQE